MFIVYLSKYFLTRTGFAPSGGCAKLYLDGILTIGSEDCNTTMPFICQAGKKNVFVIRYFECLLDTFKLLPVRFKRKPLCLEMFYGFLIENKTFNGLVILTCMFGFIYNI